MLSYQHRYHAGNFADVHKHLALVIALEYLKKKPAPFAVLDAFAGEGVYDLDCEEALRLKEYADGFERLLKLPSPSNAPQTLIDLAQALGERYRIPKAYPGSPAIIQHALREQDRAILIEKHPQALNELKRRFKRFDNIALHDRDGFEAILALTPFKESRGLIFIDPSYEVKGEYERVAEIVKEVMKHSRHLSILIWYPILKDSLHEGLVRKLKRMDVESLSHEWSPPDRQISKGLAASGLVFINPCYQFIESLEECLPC